MQHSKAKNFVSFKPTVLTNFYTHDTIKLYKISKSKAFKGLFALFIRKTQIIKRR